MSVSIEAATRTLPMSSSHTPVSHENGNFHPPQRYPAEDSAYFQARLGGLPSSNSPHLSLSLATESDCITVWKNTFASWRDSLDREAYLTESQFLTTVPLARDGGMTNWILVDDRQPSGQRRILCSCESFIKHSLASDANGHVRDVVIHGIASVFCPPEYRNRGYAARLMREISHVLPTWQPEHGTSIGSVLYSDIGKEYYARLGWIPNVTNFELQLDPVKGDWPPLARPIGEEQLKSLCIRDEKLIRAAMSEPEPQVRRRVTILPDLDHILWHKAKEDFATDYLFGKRPLAKGAMARYRGGDVWALWTHRYYGHPDEADSDNVLYILRLVVEGDETANRVSSSSSDEERPNGSQNSSGDSATDLTTALTAILQAARAEAAEWHLDVVKLWEPSPLVRRLLSQSGQDYAEIERQNTSIASGLWFDATKEDDSQPPAWINNEHYAWL